MKMFVHVILAIYLRSFVSAVETSQGSNFNFSKCSPIHTDTQRWMAKILLSKPVHLLQAMPGNVSYVHENGRYFEMIGTSELDKDVTCVTFQWRYQGQDEPTVSIWFAPLVNNDTLGRRGVENSEDSQDFIWRVSFVAQTGNMKTLLQPFEPYHHQYGDDSLSASTNHSENAALTVHYAKGSYSSTRIVRGAGFYTTPAQVPGGVQDLILTYDVYFENFGFGIGGKLPGLFGGEKGEGAYNCSGGHNPATCFSLRLMWRENGLGELYAYIPSNQQPGFDNRSDVILNGIYAPSIGRGKIQFQNGVWNTVFEQVHLNTIGHTDGWVKFCNQVAGQAQQCYTAQNLRMRNNPNHYIRGMYFNTFFGGSHPEYAAPNDCHTYFKEFRMMYPSTTVVG